VTGPVLVVGGAGFLGRHTVSRLSDEGLEAVVFDRPGSREASAGEVRVIEGSVAEGSDLEAAVAEIHPAVIIHLAAFGAPGKGLVVSAEGDPRAATVTNVTGLVNTLEIAGRERTRVVWASSTTVYAPADRYDGVVDESDLVGPRSVYAATKVLGEQLIRTYRDRHGVEAAAVRPTLVWGPGLQYRGVQAALGDMLESAADASPVTVPSGAEPWDLIYVKDAALSLVVMALADSIPPVVTMTGYVAAIDDVREEVLAQVPDAPISVEGAAPLLGFPLVDPGISQSIGFAPEYDLSRSVADYLAAVHMKHTTTA